MEAVLEYWRDKLFVVGVVLCVFGTLMGAVGGIKPGVIFETTGIILMLYAIYKVEGNEKLTESEHRVKAHDPSRSVNLLGRLNRLFYQPEQQLPSLNWMHDLIL